MASDPLADRMVFLSTPPPFPAGSLAVAHLTESSVFKDKKGATLLEPLCAVLVHKFKANVGACAKNELSIAWETGGQSLAQLVSAATAFLCREFPPLAPEKAGLAPLFDGRLFPLPSKYEVANWLLWRERAAPSPPTIFRRIEESPDFFHESFGSGDSATATRVVIRKTVGVFFAQLSNREAFLFEGANPEKIAKAI